MLLGGDSSSEEGGDAPRQRQQRAPAPTPPLIAPPQLTGLAHRVQQLSEREVARQVVVKVVACHLQHCEMTRQV